MWAGKRDLSGQSGVLEKLVSVYICTTWMDIRAT